MIPVCVAFDWMPQCGADVADADASLSEDYEYAEREIVQVGEV